MRRNVILLCVIFTLLAVIAQAQSAVGEVSFANSGALAAQQPFLRGLALLHNFEYDDAAEQFRKAQAADPSFVMAYWGEAMTYNHPVWAQQDAEAGRAVLARLAPTAAARSAKAMSERERGYLHALEILYGSGTKEERDFHYAEAMGALHARYPDDVDATALYALALLGTAHQGRDFATYMRSAALLEEVFPSHLNHPGVLHYLIHSYDDPIHAPLGLRAARRYGEVAAFAPHALHMTSHIFIALGMWDEVIAANQKANTVFNEHHAGPEHHLRECGHGITWMTYGFLQEKRFEEAAQQIEKCGQSALAEVYKGPAPLDYDRSLVTTFAEMRVLQSVETGRWNSSQLVMPEGPYVTASFTLAYGEALASAARGGNLDALHAAAARLHKQEKLLLAIIDTLKPLDPGYRQHAMIATEQIDALTLLREGKTEEGFTLVRKAAADEGAMALAFGPPVVEKPGYELLGDELLAEGRTAEARKAYEESLARAPGRTRSLEGLLRGQKTLGDADSAARTELQLARYIRAAQ